TFTVASADGTLTSVTIHILVTHDAAVLSPATLNLSGVNAAADISTSGTLTISDVDSPATFVAQAATVGSYGTFAIDAAGAWAYTTGRASSRYGAGTTDADTAPLASDDRHAPKVTILCIGTNGA